MIILASLNESVSVIMTLWNIQLSIETDLTWQYANNCASVLYHKEKENCQRIHDCTDT